MSNAQNQNHQKNYKNEHAYPINNNNASNMDQKQSPALLYALSRGYSGYVNYKVHGTSAALEIKIDQTKDSWHTIRIESALPESKHGRTTNYGWDNKISIQLTKGELPVFIAVMLTLLDECEYKNHGEDSSKGFKLVFQQDKIFANVFQKNKKIAAIPIPLVDALMIGHIALSQYTANFPQLTTDTALSGIKLLAQRLMKAKKK